MQTALAIPAPAAPADPIVTVARSIADTLRAGETIDTRMLRALFTSVTGASDADAGWSMRQAYDALELAQVLILTDSAFPIDAHDPRATVTRLVALTVALPTQSVRSEDQIALQQFSTPAPLAFLVALAASLRVNELVLEPSAGTGLLAWPAVRAGARLSLNEIDSRRRACLAHAFPDAAISSHDAELIDDLLGPDLLPDVILINPPFARSTGRGEDAHAAERHLAAAARRLRAGGRMVAIMPPRFEAARFAAGGRTMTAPMATSCST